MIQLYLLDKTLYSAMKFFSQKKKKNLVKKYFFPFKFISVALNEQPMAVYLTEF
jgi:hypothetical protein